MKVLGLDVSTTKIGIALLDDEELLVSEVIKLKSNMTLEQRAHIFEEKMLQLDDKHVIMDVYIEAPAMMFGGGRTTANTMAKLQRFNGMTSFIVSSVFDIEALQVNPLSARSVLGIKIPRKIPNKEKKRFIIDWVSEKYGDDFKYDMTRQGNPQPGTDDRADAVVIGLSGQIISERNIKENS